MMQSIGFGLFADAEQASPIEHLVRATLDALLRKVEIGDASISTAAEALLTFEKTNEVSKAVAQATIPKVSSFLGSGKDFSPAK